MVKWVTRLSRTGAHVSATQKCSEIETEVRNGITPLAICIQGLLEAGEEVKGFGYQRPIVKDSTIVGFIEVVDHPPWRDMKRGSPS